MKTRFSNSCCLIAALVVAATLTPLGTRLGEAQGRRSESLQVAIPTSDFNLTGFCNQPATCLDEYGNAIFRDGGIRGLVQAELSTTGGKAPSYVFRLLLYPGLENLGVQFDGVDFGDPTVLKDSYCEFGSTDFGTKAPECLAGFLNETTRFPTSEYRFELQVETKNLVTGTLVLYFDAYPQRVEPPERHSVVCSAEEVVISQEGATWATTGPVTLTCREYVYVRTKAPAKSYFDYRLTATTDIKAFDFQIVWNK